MTFLQELTEATRADRDALLASPVIVDCLAGQVTREAYIAFLAEAYHHVRHTVPLLMACGSRLTERHAWLRDGLVAYIAEEDGHERWILDDIAACGTDPDRVVARGPALATELMVSFVYDQVERVNPLSLFGMVFVLEGTSVSIATRAAATIANKIGLPNGALRYLLSHGSIDQKHIEDFARLVNRFDDARDRAAVVHTARVVFKLYGDMFRGLPRAEADPRIQEVA